jgi:hypothetical protein
MKKELSEFSVLCKYCGESQIIEADDVDVCRWQEGELIQDAMPYLDSVQRELLISSTCGNCWDELFSF